jgi:hypothetical protein
MRGEILRLMRVAGYFQLRIDGRRDPQMYMSLDQAAEVLVKDNRLTAQVVELDMPGGAVVREFTLPDCQEIVRLTKTYP